MQWEGGASETASDCFIVQCGDDAEMSQNELALHAPEPLGDMNPLVDRYPSLRPCDRLCTCSDTTSAPPRRLQYRAHER